MRLYNLKELRTEKGIDLSKGQIYRLISEAKFPRPIRMSEKRVAWVSEELDAWLRDRMDAREAA